MMFEKQFLKLNMASRQCGNDGRQRAILLLKVIDCYSGLTLNRQCVLALAQRERFLVRTE